MTLNSERKRIGQSANLEACAKEFGAMDMITVSLSKSNEDYNWGIHPVLVPQAMLEECMKDVSWNMPHGDGIPGAIKYRRHDQKITEYLRFGNDEGFEPLIIDREFMASVTITQR